MVFVASMSRVTPSEDDYATVAYSTSTGEELWASRYNDPADGWDGATALGVSGPTVFVTGGSDGAFATELARGGTVRDGQDADVALDRIRDALLSDTFMVPSQHRGDTFMVPSQHRGDIATLSRIPLVLALVLGLIARGTLTETLITTIRSRRRDLALLRTLGFSRKPPRATAAW
jgi:hypothetical protein